MKNLTERVDHLLSLSPEDLALGDSFPARRAIREFNEAIKVIKELAVIAIAQRLVIQGLEKKINSAESAQGVKS